MNRLFFTLMFVAGSQLMHGQIVDRVLLGQEESEKSHGLTVYCPEHTMTVQDGFMGESGRGVRRFEQNPFSGEYAGIYGGEYHFVLRVDGTKQNYLTLRTYGGDKTPGGERYRVQIDNKDLQDYSRNAVSFNEQRSPNAFAYNTLIIPRKMTDGKEYVTVRVRGVGRYYAYGTPGNFVTYQRVMTADMPPVYAVYTSTNPMFGVLEDEKQGEVAQYETAATRTSESLSSIRQKVVDGLNAAIKSEIGGSDFKPAYGNNNFNIVEVMGTAYQKGYYGGSTPDALASKIRVAIDSMVYINNLGKQGVEITCSVRGNTATRQLASAGWGGLYGDQGFGLYQIWLAGKVTDFYLDKKVDLGAGADRTRREQWIEVFKESFDYGCSKNGRRTITNQCMEAAYSVYGASLALYALDSQRFHNAPRLGLRFMREAVGLEYWTGVPEDFSFDGTLKDADGYPDFKLGDSKNTDTNVNFWGEDFHVMTAKGNGREAGWNCVNCYGNLGPGVLRMYMMTKIDPFVGTQANGNGDEEILEMAVSNEKTQAYITFPWVDAQGYRQILGEGVTCWRNRYDPGNPYYNNLVVAAISGDEELMGHVWQGYKEGRFKVADELSGNLFNYYSNTYSLPECIDKLIAYGEAHEAQTHMMPSVPQAADYVHGDEEGGVVAVKHGDEYLFVNFFSEPSLSSSGRVHVVNRNGVRDINFIPDVMEYVPSNTKETIAEVYWNGNHKITYPDHPTMADGGSVYDVPAYDKNPEHYNSMRTVCRYYQQQLGAYVVAVNTTRDETYSLHVDNGLSGKKAVNVATGEEVTLSSSIRLAPLSCAAFYLTDFDAAGGLETLPGTEADRNVLKGRVEELVPFAQKASTLLADEKRTGYYDRDSFLPFFTVLTQANYVAHAGCANQQETDDMLAALNKAYEDFVGTCYTYDACMVPGDCDYRKKEAQNGSLQVKSATNVTSAMNNAWMLIPVQAAEEGDYTVTVKARGQVADSYEPALNIDVVTDDQYWAGDMPLDGSKTQKVAYNRFSYSDYKWQIHLPAGETRLLKLTFLANASGYTVELGKMVIAEVSLYDRLQQKIVSAEALLSDYAGSELVTDAQRENLEAAVEAARGVKATASEADIASAYEALEAAMESFRQGVAEWKYPTADIQFRINNTGQAGNGSAFEVRNSSSDNRDNGFVGGIKFDVSKLAGKKCLSATLSVITMERGCKVAVYPFNADWGETGGTTDSYGAKAEYIKEALASTPVWNFSAVLGGGRKMFEWIPSKDYVYTVDDWRVEGDVTEYINKLMTKGQSEAAFLFAPDDNGSTRTTILCKDVCEQTFGTSTTGDYYLDGENIGQSNGQTVTRWTRVNQLLVQGGSPLSALYPTLTVEYEGDGVETIVISGDRLMPAEVDVYDMEGRRVRCGVPYRHAMDGLPKGIYIVNGKKYQKR